MKKLYIAITAILLSACSEPYLTYEQVVAGKAYCTSRGMSSQVGTLYRDGTDPYYITCVDQEKHTYTVRREDMK